MNPNRVAIIGNSRLAEDWRQLVEQKGIHVSMTADAERVDTNADLIVETLASGGEQKRATLERLDRASPSAVVLTSCLRWSATTLGSWVSKPERLVGFATFYPLAKRKLIELAPGLNTAAATAESAKTFIEALGKEAANVKDAPGLVFPRILSLIINEAARGLDEGIATPEEIDIALRLGTNYPQGPLRWADEIGLDEVLAVIEGLQEETGDDRYRPAPLLKKMVVAGHLGEACGRGFYSYTEQSRATS